MCRTAFSANHPQPNGNHGPEMLAMLLAPLVEACHLCISQSPRRHPHLHEGNVKCLPPGTCSASEVSLMSLLRCLPVSIVGNGQGALPKSHQKHLLIFWFLVSNPSVQYLNFRATIKPITWWLKSSGRFLGNLLLGWALPLPKPPWTTKHWN